MLSSFILPDEQIKLLIELILLLIGFVYVWKRTLSRQKGELEHIKEASNKYIKARVRETNSILQEAPSYFKSGAIQGLIGVAILSLGLSALYVMSKLMDRAAHQCDIYDKEHLSADYSTIFKTPLDRVHFLDSMRIPGARFIYTLESQEPLALRHPSQFPTINIHPGKQWPSSHYPWITKCLYRPSGMEGAEGAQGEIFVYCDSTMRHVCVLGYYGKDDIYLPLFPGAIGARIPDQMLKTGKYEKIVEFDAPESVAAEEIFAFYTAQLQKYEWTLQPSEDLTVRNFQSGKRHAGVKIENKKDRLHVLVFIESLAR